MLRYIKIDEDGVILDVMDAPKQPDGYELAPQEHVGPGMQIADGQVKRAKPPIRRAIKLLYKMQKHLTQSGQVTFPQELIDEALEIKDDW